MNILKHIKNNNLLGPFFTKSICVCLWYFRICLQFQQILKESSKFSFPLYTSIRLDTFTTHGNIWIIKTRFRQVTNWGIHGLTNRVFSLNWRRKIIPNSNTVQNCLRREADFPEENKEREKSDNFVTSSDVNTRDLA